MIVGSFENRDQQHAAQLEAEPDLAGRRRVEIVHPYLGYVVDFNEHDCGTIGFCDDRIRQYQKEFPGQLFAPGTDDNFIVAVIGGSFAYGASNGSSPGKWESVLSQVPKIGNKRIIIYTLALGGMKQPQQLNVVSLFVAMGAHFDLVINLDGFNDAVLPAVENVPRGVNPFYPRLWHRRIGRSKIDPKELRLEGQHAFLEQQQAALAENFQAGWYRNSAAANLVWELRNAAIKGAIRKIEGLATIREGEEKKIVARLEAVGPTFTRKDKVDTVRKSVKFWANTSRSLRGIADEYGFRYLHVLQPNQYLEGSKPMGAREREIAIAPDHAYARYATIAYPLLIEQGKSLIANGVNFLDLTMLFADNEEILYRDTCCHLNEDGYNYIVEAIGQEVDKLFAKE